MEFPKELKYQSSDEWVKVEADVATVGISDFAQSQLSDVVFFELTCDVGDIVSRGDTLGTVESVKAASDINFPVSGEVVAINESLADTPEVLNEDPYGSGWMVKVKLSNAIELDDLLDAAAYEQDTKER